MLKGTPQLRKHLYRKVGFNYKARNKICLEYTNTFQTVHRLYRLWSQHASTALINKKLYEFRNKKSNLKLFVSTYYKNEK
jgi:hypothetical protein